MLKILNSNTGAVLLATDQIFNVMVMDWTIDSLPEMYIDIPFNDAVMRTTRLQVLWEAGGIIYRGVVRNKLINQLSNKIVLETTHWFFDTSRITVPMNYAVKGELLSGVLADSNVIDTTWSYQQVGGTDPQVEYLFSKQNKLQSFTEVITKQTVDLHWRAVLGQTKLIEYGTFGVDTGVIFAQSETNDKVVEILDIDEEIKDWDLVNQVEVTGGTLGNGVSAVTLREYANGTLTSLPGFPVTISPLAPNTDAYYGNLPDRIRISSNNSSSFYVTDTQSVIDNGVIIQNQLSYSDLYPVADPTQQVTEQDILDTEKKVYERAVRFLKSNRLKRVYKVTTGTLPTNLKPGDRVRLRYYGDNRECIGTTDQVDITTNIDESFYILKIRKEWVNDGDRNTVTLCNILVDYRELTNSEMDLANKIAKIERKESTDNTQRRSSTYSTDGIPHTGNGNYITPVVILLKEDRDIVSISAWSFRLRIRNHDFINVNGGGLINLPAPTGIYIKVDGIDLSAQFALQGIYPNGYGIFPGIGIDQEFDILQAAHVAGTSVFQTITNSRVHTVEIGCVSGYFTADFYEYKQYTALQR